MTRKYIITFKPEDTDKSITYDLIKKFDIRISILKADIDVGKTGQLVIEFNDEQEKIKRAVSYIRERGIEIAPVGDKIRFDSSLCISCGACTSSCLSGALSISQPDWHLQFDPDKCIVCKLCLKACPLQLFHIEYSE
ncbi:MAG: 4Fe-4S binding protein [Prevotella sp.]|nr:4Fe-4S binding protein [Candidatus Equicola stercoris]